MDATHSPKPRIEPGSQTMNTTRFNISLPGLPKLGLYISLLLLPGGFIGLLLVFWLERRAGKNTAPGKAHICYAQMRGWRDLLSAVTQLLGGRPTANVPIPDRVPAAAP